MILVVIVRCVIHIFHIDMILAVIVRCVIVSYACNSFSLIVSLLRYLLFPFRSLLQLYCFLLYSAVQLLLFKVNSMSN